MTKPSHFRAAWWWIDRWRKSTAYTDMTAEAQGVYRNLLDELWLRDGVLPTGEKSLRQISGDAEAWVRVRDEVMARFDMTDAGWVNHTQREVMAESKERKDFHSKGGKARAKGAARDAHGHFAPSKLDQHAGKPAGRLGQQKHQPPDQSPDQSPDQLISIATQSQAASAANGSIKKDSMRFVDGWNRTVNGLDVAPMRHVKSLPGKVATMLKQAREYNADNPWDAITRTSRWFIEQGYTHQDGKPCGAQTFMRPRNFPRYIAEAHE